MLKKIFGHLKNMQIIMIIPNGHGDITPSNNLDNVDDFQFNVDKNFKDISILEIGSSMGKGYSFFLKNKKNIDVSNFVGIDVSRVAHQYCLTKYPETKWLNENFSEYELKPSLTIHMKDIQFIICHTLLNNSKVLKIQI